jgi:hypothetical protein
MAAGKNSHDCITGVEGQVGIRNLFGTPDNPISVLPVERLVLGKDAHDFHR